MSDLPRKDTRLYCSQPKIVKQKEGDPIAFMRFHVQIHSDYRNEDEGDELITQAQGRIVEAARSSKISPNIVIDYVEGSDNEFILQVPFADMGHVKNLEAKAHIHKTVKDVMGAVDTPERYPSH